MFTVSHLGKSSLLVLLTATLTTAAYAHSSGGGHSGSNGSIGPVVHSAPVHSSTAIVSKHDSKTLTNVHSSTAIVSKHGGKTLSNGPAAPPNATVRDHRGPDDEISNIYNTPCSGGCVGEGGLNGGAQPSQNQDHSTGPGTPQVHDHR